MKLIIGIDEYPESENTYQSAAGLAEGLKAEVEFVHAAAVPSQFVRAWKGQAKGELEALSALRMEMLGRMLKWSKGTFLEGQNPDNQLTVDFARAAGLLAAEATKQKADWLVIGKHRKHGLLDFGNTMRQTFAASSLPIWVQVGPWKKPQTILAAIDLSPISHEVLERTRELAAAFGAKVQVIYCFSSPTFANPYADTEPDIMPNYVIEGLEEDDKKRFDALFDDFDWKGVNAQKKFAHGDPVDYLRDATESFDLTVMGQHGEGWISATVMGSIAYGVLKQAQAPVLLLRHLG